jgi:hypothetical protein
MMKAPQYENVVSAQAVTISERLIFEITLPLLGSGSIMGYFLGPADDISEINLLQSF